MCGPNFISGLIGESPIFPAARVALVRKIGNAENITPVAGLIFEAKIERFFLESFFRERNFCPEQLSRAKNVARF